MREIYKKSLLTIIKNNGKCAYVVKCDNCPFSYTEDGIHQFCVISRNPEFNKQSYGKDSLKWIKNHAIEVFLDNYNECKEELMEILL